jgi:hypothetical protein
MAKKMVKHMKLRLEHRIANTMLDLSRKCRVHLKKYFGASHTIIDQMLDTWLSSEAKALVPSMGSNRYGTVKALIVDSLKTAHSIPRYSDRSKKSELRKRIIANMHELDNHARDLFGAKSNIAALPIPHRARSSAGSP